MARVTSNRKIEDLGTVKRVDKFDAPAIETEAARLVQAGDWRAANLAIDLTAVALTIGGVDSDAQAGFVAGRAGFIDSIVYSFSAAISAGGASAAQVQPTVAGTAVDVAQVIPSGGGSAVSAVVDMVTPVAFNEGDKLGVVVTTSHTFAPTTCDLTAWLMIRWAA